MEVKDSVHYYLKCETCKATFNGDEGLYQCRICGGRLWVQYGDRVIKDNWIDLSKQGIWKFWRLLPINNPANAVTLGEGNTPLLKCQSLARLENLAELWIKYEGTNPTGSFKDRNAAVSVTKAVELKAKAVAIASDGNAGPAVAAYAAKAGLPCYVFMPSCTAPQDIAHAMTFGAQVFKVRGEGMVNDCIALIEELKDDFQWHHLTTAGPVNPYQLEGPKTIAYEIALDFGGVMPDWIAIPAGGGGLLVAVFRALKELECFGLIDRLPRLLCVQAEACAPIVKAFQERRPIEQWRNPGPTKAIPIAVPLPLDGAEAIRALDECGGQAVSVNETEISHAQDLLASREGIYASAAGSVALAGALKARKLGIINASHRVVVLVTASGLKALGSYASGLLDRVPEVTGVEDVRKSLRGLF